MVAVAPPALGAIPDAREFRELIDSSLRELDADDRGGALLRATDLSLRIEITDLDLVVRVAPGDGADYGLNWNFEDLGEMPRLELRMDSATAHRYLEGRESIAVAIAKGKVELRGESRFALLYLPVIGHVAARYRRLAQERFPHLDAV